MDVFMDDKYKRDCGENYDKRAYEAEGFEFGKKHYSYFVFFNYESQRA